MASLREIKAHPRFAETCLDMAGVSLRGRRLTQIHCPLPAHQDKRPSAAVYEDGHFYCYTCQEGGSGLDLVANVLRLEFTEASRRVADALGMGYAPARRSTASPAEPAPVRQTGALISVREELRMLANFQANINRSKKTNPMARWPALTCPVVKEFDRHRCFTRASWEALAAEAGVDPAKRAYFSIARLSPFRDKEPYDRAAILACNEAALEFFRNSFLASPGETYLYSRGFTPETRRLYEIGYAPEDRGALLRHLASRHLDAFAARAGLLARDGRSYFFGRLVFPIRNRFDELVGFAGRSVGQAEPKYLNTRESPLFQKGGHLYGLTARSWYTAARWYAWHALASFVVLVEGYADVWRLRQMGILNVAATMGTGLTPAQMALVKDVGQAYLMFDNDQGGQGALMRVVPQLIRQGVWPLVVRYEGKDPDEWASREQIPWHVESAFGAWLDGLGDDKDRQLAALLDSIADPWGYECLVTILRQRQEKVPPAPAALGGIRLATGSATSFGGSPSATPATPTPSTTPP